MPDWYFRQIESPYIFLIFGVVSISAAAVWTCTGKEWVRFQLLVPKWHNGVAFELGSEKHEAR